jgi:hypothetical protein
MIQQIKKNFLAMKINSLPDTFNTFYYDSYWESFHILSIQNLLFYKSILK